MKTPIGWTENHVPNIPLKTRKLFPDHQQNRRLLMASPAWSSLFIPLGVYFLHPSCFCAPRPEGAMRAEDVDGKPLII